jgi:hypothetical protein
MNLTMAVEPHDILVVTLHDGCRQTTVSVCPAAAGAQSLDTALTSALADGYGECFWPALNGGQYWWVFKRDADTLETIAMWTRGGASLWEHVFRATDSAAWLRGRLRAEMQRLGLEGAPGQSLSEA